MAAVTLAEYPAAWPLSRRFFWRTADDFVGCYDTFVDADGKHDGFDGGAGWVCFVDCFVFEGLIGVGQDLTVLAADGVEVVCG